MSKKLLIKFAGTDAPVDLTCCPDVFAYIPALFQNWPYEILTDNARTQESILRIENRGHDYRISSALNGKIQDVKDPLNTACSLVAELAWLRLHKQPELLCFHGAAVEFNDHLVLFPNRQRAGKSTLAACLAAQGRKVFTDDYLPLELDEIAGLFGVANGAAPRLRLPVPNEFSACLKTYLKDHAGPNNKQYLYLRLKENLLARHGERLAISTIILLDRVDTARPELLGAQPPEVLRRLIKQNFSRCINPARILELLGLLISNTQLKTLRYSNAEQAAELLDCTLGKAPETKKHVTLNLRSSNQLFEAQADNYASPAPFTANRHYVQARTVVQLPYDEECFVASSNGAKIHHLDRISKAIWTMLETPITSAEIVAVFRTAFPDQPVEVIEADITKAMSNFVRNGLLATYE